MIYKAVVIDNSDFFKKGTIRVRIAGYFLRNFDWDLKEDYPGAAEEGESSNGSHQDFNAILFSPLGGGRNYGVLFLPQINEKGIVSFLGGNKRKPVWMGSIFEPSYGDNHSVEYTNIPSDDPTKEGVDSDGALAGEHNMDADSLEDALNKNIVVRTKNTFRGGASDVDWEQRPTTNIISVGEKALTFTHFSEDGGYDGTTPKKWQEIKSYVNDDGEDVISIKVNNGDDSTQIEVTDSEIRFIGDDDNLVRHADLAEFLDVFLEHQHVAPNGPTINLIDGTMKPIAIELGQLINKFKAEKLKTEGSG